MIVRALAEADMPLVFEDSEYEDFGPRGPRTDVPNARVERDGQLAIDVDGEVIGTVGWHWVGYGPNEASRCPMLGIYLAPEFRGKGYGTEAQRLATDLLFRYTLVNRVEASTDVTNIAEQRVLEKLGFTREGVMRGSQYRSGRFHDLVMYAVLRDEWVQ